ncbi:hypothetical protein DH2020_020076 [Rehmannia glutinosa]|uniref:Zinc finger BED domain-containing protein RICESLEEPER 2-like n=1 Tax=Rehmannia glutinosa TaxID=99300 RepID=A0ABR0WF74_REHGL
MKKQKDGTTTQYRRHLNGCIKRSLNIKGQQNLCLVPSTRRSESVSVHSWKYDQAKMREVISHMIMVHELPFSFVEYELFNLVMQSATPYYQRISRATTKNDCWTSYELEKKRIKGLLKSVDKVSITTDIWTSGQNIQYMVMTAHFIDSDWKLQKRILNFVDVPPPHTGTVVCDALYKCLQDWGIEEKIWTITVDNASYNDSTVRILLDCLSFHKSLPLNSQLFHVRCCAHILNLLVQDGLSEIKEIIEDVRESVKYISASSNVCITFFTKFANNFDYLPKKKLILDCCTRWNATYAMLSCALEFKQVFPRYALRDSNYRHLPTDDDWHRVEEFEKYWGNNNLLLSIAAVLDPRNKMTLIQFAFPVIYPETEAKKQISVVRDSLHELYKAYMNEHTFAPSQSFESELQSSNPSNKGFTASNHATGKNVETGRSKYEKYVRSVDTVQHVKSELDTYLDEGVFICEGDSVNFNALEWWKSNNLKFRVLSKMACEILSIPITTVASESTFSAGGRVIDTYRSYLGTDTVQMLLCGRGLLLEDANHFFVHNRIGKYCRIGKHFFVAIG